MSEKKLKDQSLLDHKPEDGPRSDREFVKIWGGHTFDVRLTVPWLFGGFYIVFLAGKERRPKERRKTEQKDRKLFTSANLMFFIMLMVWIAAVGFVLWEVAKSFMGFI